MTWRTRKWIWLLAALLALAAAAWAARTPVLRGLGGLLVFERAEFRRVDAVVVLPGSVPDRVLEAYELMSAGRAGSAFLLAGQPRERGEILTALGIEAPGDRELNRRVLLAKGIDPERVLDVPGMSGSSLEDGRLVKEFLRGRTVRSLAVVTCRYHSHRAYLVFREALKDTGTEVYSTPSRYCSFDAGTWWREPGQAKTGVLELVKLTAYWLGYQ